MSRPGPPWHSVPVLHHSTFRAMDTDIEVMAASDDYPIGCFASIRVLFATQEQRFSRFLPESLVSRLNRGETVSDGFLDSVLRMAIEGWEETGGLFNPMVLPALARAGYDRTFAEVRTEGGGAPSPVPVPSPIVAFQLDAGAVTLREGQLDLGGIVKGWTADLAVETLMAECPDLLVNAGGDLRAAGVDPGLSGGLPGWEVAVDRPGGGQAWLGRVDGGLATSTSLKRRWTTADGRAAHHLIDPRTGLPADSPYVQVSCWAPQTWRAEVWAKAVLIGGPATAEFAGARGLGVLAFRAGNAADRFGAP